MNGEGITKAEYEKLVEEEGHPPCWEPQRIHDRWIGAPTFNVGRVYAHTTAADGGKE